ncbi:hypothetical protein TWF225_004353 [Orbilia oligospora]|nr:hypothetical protein TWF225_004353 [Orbilia oligospora]KAF3293422.1 hypothetical protein TWF132_004742 [Orbilia oligospora]
MSAALALDSIDRCKYEAKFTYRPSPTCLISYLDPDRGSSMHCIRRPFERPPRSAASVLFTPSASTWVKIVAALKRKASTSSPTQF